MTRELNKALLIGHLGRMQSRQWEGDAGKPYFSTEVVARELIVLGAKRETAQLDELEFKR